MILMYHHVAPPESVPFEHRNINHTPAGFERQLRELLRRGYRFESLSDCLRNIGKTGAETPRTVQLTFDDGWVDHYQFALPILRKLGLTATFFVTTEHVHRGIDDPAKMSARQMLELLDAGMTIGGHSRSHPTLTALSLVDARAEIAGCRDDLQKALGIEADFFAYPGGAFNPSVAQLVVEAGYRAACSVIGPARNDASTTYWLYRDVLTEEMNAPRDRYRLSPLARRLLEFRVKKRLALRLLDR